jgi:hypothetical protein
MAYFLSDDGPAQQGFKGKAKGGFALPTDGQAPHLGAIDYGSEERFGPKPGSAAPTAADYTRPAFAKGSASGAQVRGGSEAAAAFSHAGADEERFARRGSDASSAADYVRPTFGRGGTAKAVAAEGAGGAAAAFSHDGADVQRFAHRQPEAEAEAEPAALSRPTFGRGSSIGAQARGGDQAAAAFGHDGADVQRFAHRQPEAEAEAEAEPAALSRPTFGRGSSIGAQARGGDQAAAAFGHDGADEDRFTRNHKPGSTAAPLARPQFARKQQLKDDSSGMHGIFGESAATATAPPAAQSQPSPEAGNASRPWGTHEEIPTNAHARPTPRGDIAAANHDHGAHITATMDSMVAAQAIKAKNSGAGSSIFG